MSILTPTGKAARHTSSNGVEAKGRIYFSADVVPSAARGPSIMQIAQIGPWEFEIPEGWRHIPSERSSSYFENPEGTKGLYVKAIDLQQPKENASQVASYIQDAHFRGFTTGTNSWEVVDRRVSSEGALIRSALDIYDAAANYRVLSLVLATSDAAVQVSVHDYWCEDYNVARNDFAALESSIARAPSAA